MEKIKGVNLGNWFVLEKWMSPGLFEGTTAEDEYYLPTQLPKEIYEERIRRHRAEYITERDFIAIRALGLNAVRIPVPYFIFGDRAPFVGCIDGLDRAMEWAEKHGLKVLIDLHTAPDSQNGFDNGGISGVCKFFQEPEEIEFVYTVLERLAERYGNREGLWGIEILNEPASAQMWEMIKTRYAAVDPEKAAGSRGYEMEELRAFYLTAYDRIMKYLPYEKKVVMHDGFDILAWKDFMRDGKYRNVILDTHQYLMMVEAFGLEPTKEGYVQFIEEHFAKDVAEMQQYFPVICGEWCLSNAISYRKFTDAVTKEERGCTKEERDEIMRALDRAQKATWDKGSGYFYWSWKLHIDTALRPESEGTEPWDLGRAALYGWFEPEK